MDSINHLHKHGERIVVRSQEVCEVISYTIRIEKPLERVYVIPYRNNNIFSTIAETMWDLAGRNDLDFLMRYLKRANNFSDDGSKWRAGYGPRLRNWGGVDQINEVVRILTNDRSSRRAVMNLFDVETDYGDYIDVPCNNWLHFIIRNNFIELSVALRSNDIMWGFSGINTFRWSVLHEMIAYWTNSEVGRQFHYMASFHLYNRHYKRAKEISESMFRENLYDFGFSSPKFSTPLPKFNEKLLFWYELETRLRNREVIAQKEIESLNDELLINFLLLLKVYNSFLYGESRTDIAKLVSQLPSNDMKVAVIEFLTRHFKDKSFFRLNDNEQKFFDYYWSCY
ncbi:Thymidylate synthase [compost metagenome]